MAMPPEDHNGSASGRIPAAAFDGIICIGGEDWWYHNRGHFDFQIMRRLARRCPVLFVNSIGVRMPSARKPGLFLTRIGRKLKSLSRGLVEVEPQFFVMSPVVAPGKVGQHVSGWALAPQIKLAALRCGIRRPLLWVHCPAGAALVDEIESTAVVLQRTDRFEAFPEASSELVGHQIASLKRAADLVVYAAPGLMADETGTVARQLLITHGVDLERFVEAGRARREPEDCLGLSRPRVGFVGGIDHHTFAPAMFLQVARRLPECDFMLVGGCSLPEDWCKLPNVHLLGRKPYDEVADYMAAADVLIMPWNDSDWIRACNPIKLKEYLATGRPVVTTDFPALGDWRDLVHVAEGAEAFAAAIRTALAQNIDHGALLARLASETWEAKADQVALALAGLGDMRIARAA